MPDSRGFDFSGKGLSKEEQKGLEDYFSLKRICYGNIKDNDLKLSNLQNLYNEYMNFRYSIGKTQIAKNKSELFNIYPN